MAVVAGPVPSWGVALWATAGKVAGAYDTPPRQFVHLYFCTTGRVLLCTFDLTLLAPDVHFSAMELLTSGDSTECTAVHLYIARSGARAVFFCTVVLLYYRTYVARVFCTLGRLSRPPADVLSICTYVVLRVLPCVHLYRCTVRLLFSNPLCTHGVLACTWAMADR
jgi:hypothetical protein